MINENNTYNPSEIGDEAWAEARKLIGKGICEHPSNRDEPVERPPCAVDLGAHDGDDLANLSVRQILLCTVPKLIPRWYNIYTQYTIAR